MKYEQTAKNTRIKGKSKKVAKREKSKGERIAGRQISLMHFLGRTHRALGISPKRMQGWID